MSFISSHRNQIDNIIQNLEKIQDTNSFYQELSYIDHELSQKFSAQNYQPNIVTRQMLSSKNNKKMHLGIPNLNSLTDSMLRTTLGCEQTLAKSYMQIIDPSAKKEQEMKKNRIESAKKKFGQTNSHKKFIGQDQPFMSTMRFRNQKPLIENERQVYLKTQLLFLQQPSNLIKNQKSSDPQNQTIVKKIGELGGLQDTVGRMEKSLAKNQIKNLKKKQVLQNEVVKNLPPFNALSPKIQRTDGQSWLAKSKALREALDAAF